METAMTKKIIDALENYQDVEKFRELVAEILASKMKDVPTDENEEIVSEETLTERTQELKKVIAAAKRMAWATGDTEVEVDDPFVEAVEVDETVERLKQAACYEAGKIDYEEMVKRLIDRAEARLVVMADNLMDMAEVAIPKIMSKVKFLAPYVPLAQKVIPMLKPAAKKLVTGGIKKVAEMARKAAPVVIEKVGKVVAKIKDKIKIFLS